MLETIALLDNLRSELAFKVSDNFYQQLDNISNTTLSLQYDRHNFLTFKVYEASQGVILRQEVENIALQCRIRGATYRFTREHLEQLSNRELRELFDHLGVQVK